MATGVAISTERVKASLLIKKLIQQELYSKEKKNICTSLRITGKKNSEVVNFVSCVPTFKQRLV